MSMRYSAKPRKNSGKKVSREAVKIEPVKFPSPPKTTMIRISTEHKNPIWPEMGAINCM